jgi:hypothetical protein
MTFGAEIPLIVGLLGVAVAVLERGYKRFLEEKKLDPTIKFGGTYMLNLLVSTGVGTALVVAVIPALITSLQTGQEVSEGVVVVVGFASVILNFILGYTTTYRILDALNTSTERKLELARAEAAATPPPVPSTPPAPTPA